MVKLLLVPIFLTLGLFHVGECSAGQETNLKSAQQPTNHLHANERAGFVCPESNGVFPTPGQCTGQYYACKDGIPYPQTCGPYEIFDPLTLSCIYYDQASCKQKYNCTSDGIFPYPGSTCAQFYYICSAGQSYMQYCPLNYVFDPVDLKCKPMVNAGCTAPAITTTTTTTEPTTTTTTTEPTTTTTTTEPTTTTTTTEPTTTTTTTEPTTTTTTTEQTTTTTTTEPTTTTTTTEPTTATTTTQPTTATTATTTTTTQPSVEFTCPSNPSDMSDSGLYPNPNDCGSFYQCSNGTPNLMLCPGNLYYNPALQVCDWPQNVDCNQPVQRKGILLPGRLHGNVRIG